MINIAIIGAAGRMGRALLGAALANPEFRIVGAVVSPHGPAPGLDVGQLAGTAPLGLRTTVDLTQALAGAQVVLDFSTAAATRTNLAACRELRKPLLLGTTGIGADLSPELTTASAAVPLLLAPNTSVGMSVLTELVRLAAARLRGFDIQIIDVHHRSKRDAPSGSALALAAAAAEARGTPDSGEIGFAALRAGDIVGEHTVLFAGPGERLTLAHQATDRAIFARGALEAAAWLSCQAPGRYTMRDFILAKSEG